MPKLTALTALSPILGTDIAYVVSDPGGTPVSKKGTVNTLFTSRAIATPTITDGVNTVSSPGTTSIGYLGIPQNSQSAPYTAVMTDAGKHILHPAADNNPRTFTIPANASVAYPIGTAITFVNLVNTLTIAITSDTLTWAQNGSTGSRTLAANGIATALKITATLWLISGTGLS
jgi:hypothetical protein